jgi:alanyl-tRNA synthetase
MTSQEIRQHFLDFFKEKGHQIVPSAPLVVKGDPTLMFTNAGMNQFKDYFLGTRPAIHPRIADTQKCLRVSGKHNDLEEVGIDTYHHTMFEMLGNWSFGDYFKREAIGWAWELLTKIYHLPEDQLYASVFGGDEGEGLEADGEAFDIWKEILPEDRILYGSKKDNFWEMGDTGPCGPCSEIHIDLRDAADRKALPGRELVNTGHPLVIEIWNLVFIQFNRKADGRLENLPERHVDTGMGFERLVMAVQGRRSNYDTDVFRPLMDALCRRAGVTYGQDEKTDIAVRVVADHVRAVSFAIADGQLPSNTGAGYVIRRILRRAVRYGFTYLNFSEPFICYLVPVLADKLGDVFPEIRAQQEFVSRVIMEEEQSFLRTLENGIRIFEEAYRGVQLTAKKGGEAVLSGETAFKLYDTFGFPLDLTLLLAREKNARIDLPAFERAMAEQKSRSKTAAQKETGDWVVLDPEAHTEFVGYEYLEYPARILRYRQLADQKRTVYHLVLDKTPFYAESGGQVGDTGYLTFNGEKIRVFNTRKENELIVHEADRLPQDPGTIMVCRVDEEKRRLTESNHSCTHLLHAALRKVLGEHVQQKGSYVSHELLRFDFSHFGKMTSDEIGEVERIVNERIRQDIRLDERRQVPFEEAKAMGAMALFGEKYGNFVRVITFDPSFSVELCGGTHVHATGKIGFFKILSESSIAAGVRRIEAVTSVEAEKYVAGSLKTLEEVRELMNHPKDLRTAVAQLLEEKNRLHRQLEHMQAEKARQIRENLAGSAVRTAVADVIVSRVDLPNADALRKISFELKGQFEKLFLVLAAAIDGKPQIAVMIAESLLQDGKLDASRIVKELAREIQGGGGGQPFYATAGGKDIGGLERVVNKAGAMVREFGLVS